MSNAKHYWYAPSWFLETKQSREIFILKFPSTRRPCSMHTHTPLPYCRALQPFRSSNICSLSTAPGYLCRGWWGLAPANPAQQCEHLGRQQGHGVLASTSHISPSGTRIQLSNLLQDCALILNWRQVNQNGHFLQERNYTKGLLRNGSLQESIRNLQFFNVILK